VSQGTLHSAPAVPPATAKKRSIERTSDTDIIAMEKRLLRILFRRVNAMITRKDSSGKVGIRMAFRKIGCKSIPPMVVRHGDPDHHFIRSISSALTEFFFLYRISTIASPRTLSAAATVTMKIVKMDPYISFGVRNRETATMLMLTALRMSSVDIKIPIALRRVIMP
jgi:hypothetical protein